MIDIINGHSVDVMCEMEAESIDSIVTDPPYMQNYKTNRRKNKDDDFCSPIKNDINSERMITLFINEAYRVLKDNAAMLCFCNTNKIDFFKQEIEHAGFKIKNIIVWEKNNHTAGDLKAALGHTYEFIILANKGRRLINGKRDTDIVRFNRVAGNKQVHQNQKPVELMSYLLEKWTDPGDLVLDPFMGSGSTGVAAKIGGRNFIGIEIEKRYCKLAESRLKELAVHQGD